MPQTREHVLLARQVGVPVHRGGVQQGGHGRRRGDPRAGRARGPRALNEYEFPGDDIPVVRVSALKALEGDAEGAEKILELMAAVDAYMPEPARDIDKPFLMPIEDVFSITGRGTVVTGKVEQGIVKVNEEVEIVGIGRRRRRCDRRRDVPQAARSGPGGRQHRRLAAGHEEGGGGAGSGAGEAGLDHAAHRLRGAGVRARPRKRVAGTRRSSRTTGRSSTSARPTSPGRSTCRRAPRCACPATTPS